MNLLRGVPLLYQQFKALFKKNLLLSWRSKRATFLQLFSSFFFIFLIFIIQEARQAQMDFTTAYNELLNPKPLVAPPIPPCEDKFYINLPCFDFVWSGNDSQRIGRIVTAIMKNNPGRPIPDSKVKSFRTADEVDEWLFNNDLRAPGAMHFLEINSTIISCRLQTNSTAVEKRGEYEDPTFKFQITLQIAAEREIATSLIGDPNLSWFVGFKVFAHPAMEYPSIIAMLGPAFFLAIAEFNFVLQIGHLVMEKELKLRQAMTMMGLFDTAYWLLWLAWEGIITLISSLFIVLFGMMFQFDFFLHNDFAILFFLFFLFQLNMVGFAFLISPFIRKSSSAITVGFSIFIVGFLTQVVTAYDFSYSTIFKRDVKIIWSFFPSNLLAKAIIILSDATATPEDAGVRCSRRAECAPNDGGCVITIDDIYKWLTATFFLWVVLAIYFDNIIPSASGVRKLILYFFKPGFWTGKGGKVKEGGLCSCISSIPRAEDIAPNDEDVFEEENIVKQQTREDVVDPNVAVQIRGLAKTYPGSWKIGCRCKCKKTSHTMLLRVGELRKESVILSSWSKWCWKTTVINCLTGTVPVTTGDGFCPQFDILWDALSGQEHLQLFASIKGLPPASIKSVVQKSLAEVKLTEAAKVRAGSYSGGMKRHLSVAVALIGDPKSVILDEPPTGMDPIARRHVWDLIKSEKKGRAVVLTTHSMEEADILCDQIGIMAKGRLRCIGTSIRLKSRFGTGFVTNFSFTGDNNGLSPFNSPFNEDEVTTTYHHEFVKQFFKSHLNVVPREENKAFLTFVIPHDREKLLTKFFTELQDGKREFGIADIQLGLATLEEVFLNIALQAELESAGADQRLVTLTLASGDSLEIPVGARFVGIPGTESEENPRGVMVEVYWEQDDTGSLCISGHSSEIPIPMETLSASNTYSFGRRTSF